MTDFRKWQPDLERIAGQYGSDSYAAGTFKRSDSTLEKEIAALVPDEDLTLSDVKWLSDQDNPGTPETPSPALKAITNGIGAGQLFIFKYPVAELTINVRCIFYYA